MNQYPSYTYLVTTFFHPILTPWVQGAVRSAEDAPSNKRVPHMVRVLFRSEALRDQCANTDAMTAAWGVPGAALVRLKLQQLSAAETMDDLRFLQCTSLPIDDDLTELDFRGHVVFVVANQTTNGGIPSVHEIVVEEIRVTEAQRA
jgi:hypothetical protein